MEHVLVVDDDYDVRTVMTLMIEHLGIPVRTASNGLSAIQEIEESPPKMVLLDLAMPHLGGMSVLEHLHGHPTRNALPVLVVTAHPIRDTKIAARFANVIGILEKGAIRVSDIRAYVGPIFGLE